MQRQHLQAWHQTRQPIGLARVDHQAPLISWVHLMQLHQDRAAFGAKWRMLGTNWVAQVAARWIVALFIGKGAREHQDFFATTMTVPIEAAAGGIAHNRAGAGHFTAEAIEHAPLHARQRRWGPGQGGGV